MRWFVLICFTGSAFAQALVNRYCAGCHQQGFQTTEMREKAIRRVQAGLMPPQGMPRPDPKAFIESMEKIGDAVAANPALHRLNRTEYANSIRGLLAVDVDVSALLPADDMSHGFDNMADVLTISPALMQGYVRAAGRISREAVGDPAALALTSTYSVSRVTSQTRHVEGTPFGTRGGMAVVHHFPADGEYVFTVGFYYSPTGPLFGLNQGKGQQIEITVNGERVALLELSPRMQLSHDGLKTPPIMVKAGPQRISAAFPQTFDGPIEDEFRMVEQSLVDVSAGTIPGMTTLPHLHQLSITGPTSAMGVSETPSRRKIFTCHDGDDSCARQILARLARQAYRRPVGESDVESLMRFYKMEANFEDGIRTAIQAMIASPQFVFRFEKTPEGVKGNYRISDVELASRLSYFLWSSAPDEELLSVAERGQLKDPAVLEKQVRRMLADAKASALTSNFAGQWLRLQNLKNASPDLLEFPDFDRTLADAMRRETELLFESIVREDRNVTDLLTADYTFVNERLAKHYGIPNVMGNRFRRVTLSDPNRFGLLGQASFLTITSTAIRTSPVQRGKYVMEVLLGTPPPPPPPVVPALPESAAHAVNAASVRQRLEEHRKNPNCAGCHKLMDPIGFSLENFDAVGVWRDRDGGFAVDPSGVMFDGSKLDGPASLRRAVLKHSDLYLETFAGNLLAYGVGRVLEASDMPVVRGVVREAELRGDRFSEMVLGVVRSGAFQMRFAE
jgi:hypothetical protein